MKQATPYTSFLNKGILIKPTMRTSSVIIDGGVIPALYLLHPAALTVMIKTMQEMKGVS